MSQRPGHRPHALVEHRVARDPDHAALVDQREADHVADDRLTERRTVPARRGDHLDRRLARRLEPGPLPRAQPAGVAAEALGARRGGDHGPGPRQQRAAGRIEVVLVMVVAEQHGVDRRQLVRRDRRAGDLVRGRSPAELVVAARRVERRIGEQRPAAQLDQRGRSADVGELHVGEPIRAAGRRTGMSDLFKETLSGFNRPAGESEPRRSSRLSCFWPSRCSPAGARADVGEVGRGRGSLSASALRDDDRPGPPGDGSVLVAGGGATTGAGPSSSTGERYDPE